LKKKKKKLPPQQRNGLCPRSPGRCSSERSLLLLIPCNIHCRLFLGGSYTLASQASLGASADRVLGSLRTSCAPSPSYCATIHTTHSSGEESMRHRGPSVLGVLRSAWLCVRQNTEAAGIPLCGPRLPRGRAPLFRRRRGAVHRCFFWVWGSCEKGLKKTKRLESACAAQQE
jgi:hypothetical protein